MDRFDEMLASAAQNRRELDEMHAAYEEIDAREYEEFNREMDARDAELAQRYQD
ncbi:hypothetical protein ACGFN1_36065 [Streptomyces sp. NPDC048685]|uniref:hypothetical protein n=1 Tax=unclassified Streptomyces TaxID=2593676 RepID=UPI002E3390B3|nr:hypothetical protein [Streptomyces sp. NBC_01362]